MKPRRATVTTGWLVTVALAVGLACTAEAAGKHGTSAEAKAMLAKAVAHVKAVGNKQAFLDFTARRPPFFDRNLYVVCIAANRRIGAHGGFATDVGLRADVLKDPSGKNLGQAMWDAATKGKGELRYRIVEPLNEKVESKIGFFEKVGEDVCGVSATSS